MPDTMEHGRLEGVVPALRQFMTQVAGGLMWGRGPGTYALGMIGFCHLPARERGTVHLDFENANFLISVEWKDAPCPA